MIILAIIIFVCILILLILLRIKDKAFLKRSVKDVLSDRVREDILKDKEDFVRRQAQFEKHLKNNKKMTHG